MKIISDNLRITLPSISQAVKEKNPDPIEKLVKKCADLHPWAIDVNTGPLGRHFEADMVFIMDAVQNVTDLPLLIDTTNAEAMRVAVDHSKNPLILNGVSLEKQKLEQILPLAKEADVDIVGFLLYPDSRVPQDEAGRFQIAVELCEMVRAAGISQDRLIIDPVVPPLVWNNGIEQARAVLDVIRMLPELLGFDVRTIAGLSNLATGAAKQAGKGRVEQSYATLLAGAGLTYLLMDVLNDSIRNAAVTADLLLEQEIFSWAMLD